MMRTSGQIRFYAFAATLILLIALSFFFAPSGSLQRPAEIFDKYTGTHLSNNGQQHHDAEPVFHESRPPYIGIDEELPELTDWPGADADGKYNDWTDMITEEQHQVSNQNQRREHLNISSKMTSDGRYVRIDWGSDHEGYNPSIIPHPEKEDTWIMIAQRDKSADTNNIYSIELYCEAVFVNDTLKCTKSPLSLSIASTASEYCLGELDWFNANVGPHDARMFHGPQRPYILYNQQSKFNCIGQWIHDARRLVDYGGSPPQNASERFFYPTNLQKVGGKYRGIEKNWFPFWDSNGTLYLHYTITPQRKFAKLEDDGSVGTDLGPVAAAHDNACLEKLMPKLQDTGLEWIHQATNALELTMCKRSDPTCESNDENTFIITLFQTKTFYAHGQYEPYFLLFKRTAPFEIYGISKTPFWYHGRGKAFGDWRVDLSKPKDQAQMVFTTSLSWKKQGQTYHGYLDDEMMMCFGIEDKHSGTMDVTIGELIEDVALC